MHRRPLPRREAESPWVSFADVLTGLLFVFIALTFWTSWQLLQEQAAAAAEKARLTGADALAAALIGTAADPGPFSRCLKSDAGGSGIEDTAPDPLTASVAIYLEGGTPWFNACSDDLRDPAPPGADAVRAAAVRTIHRCVEETILVEATESYRISITFEGHTDMGRSDACPGKPGLSNWRLSGARAAAVLETFLVQASSRTDPIPAAIADKHLQVVAAGLSDTRPAWSAICRQSDAADKNVCARLDAGQQARTDLLDFLQRPGLTGYRCRGAVVSAADQTDSELLRLWANSCPTTAGHEARLDRLRRVDVRLELRPETD